MANLIPDKHRPYVGGAAFAHKGGIHASAVRKNSDTYEHIDPSLVGNSQRFLVSDLSGESHDPAARRGNSASTWKTTRRRPERYSAASRRWSTKAIKFEGAEASLELLMKRALGTHKKYFDLIGFRVVAEKQERSLAPSEATIMLKVGDKVEHTAAFGNGPVNALDGALRKALHKFYPVLRSMTLVDYKVRALSTREGTGTVIRVLIESSDGVRDLGDGGRLREHHRGKLAGPRGQHRLQAASRRGERMKRLLNIRDATKDLNILRSLDSYKRPFELLGTYRLIDDGRRPEATVSIKADHGEMHEAATGVGPVDALANVLKKSLASIFPFIRRDKARRFLVEDPRHEGRHVRERGGVDHLHGREGDMERGGVLGEHQYGGVYGTPGRIRIRDLAHNRAHLKAGRAAACSEVAIFGAGLAARPPTYE